MTFPGALQRICELLPFRCLVQVPCDVLLREDTGTGSLPLIGLQLPWAAALLGLGAMLTRAAVRKVVSRVAESRMAEARRG